MIALGPRRAPRRIGLTPMVDVVFLLLVFFMLAARFDTEMAVPLARPGGGAEYEGAPRLIDLFADRVILNGVAVEPAGLVAAIRPLMPRDTAAILLRPRGDADVQRVVEMLDLMAGAGFANVVLVGE